MSIFVFMCYKLFVCCCCFLFTLLPCSLTQVNLLTQVLQATSLAVNEQLPLRALSAPDRVGSASNTVNLMTAELLGAFEPEGWGGYACSFADWAACVRD